MLPMPKVLPLLQVKKWRREARQRCLASSTVSGLELQIIQQFQTEQLLNSFSRWKVDWLFCEKNIPEKISAIKSLKSNSGACFRRIFFLAILELIEVKSHCQVGYHSLADGFSWWSHWNSEHGTSLATHNFQPGHAREEHPLPSPTQNQFAGRPSNETPS